MLKDTLEHKRLSSQVEKQVVDDDSNGVFSPQDACETIGFREQIMDNLKDDRKVNTNNPK